MKPTCVAPRLVAFVLALSLAASSPAFGLRPEKPSDSPRLREELRAGLEERVAQGVAILEEAAQGGSVAIVEATALERAPVLQAVIGRFERLVGRVILWGESPAAQELNATGSEISWARTPADLSDILGSLTQRERIDRVTYLGGLEEGTVVQAIAKEWGLSFVSAPPTLVQLLAAFIPGPLAAELAAGLEQEEAFAGQA